MGTRNTSFAIGGGILAAALGLFWYSDLYLGTYMVNFFHTYGLQFLVLTAVLVLAVVLFAVDRIIAAGVVAVLGVLAFFGLGMYGSYLEDKAYAREYVENQEDLQAFAERTAWEVANNRVDSDKGDLKGTTLSPRYRPTEETFGTLVEAPGFTSGYAGVVEQRITPAGATTATTCSFGNGDGRGGFQLSGNLDGSLEREISHLDRALIIESGDAYGYCDEDVAVAVVPLKEKTGFYPVLEEPAGVAVYREGEVTIDREVEAGEYPGPVYPTSLAAKQREALKAVDSNWWTWMKSRAGFTEATAEGDPNSENPTEFLLTDPDKDSTLYVTPMTSNPKQKQAKITAYVVMPADTVTAGERQKMELVLVPLEERREANGVVVDNIKSYYSDADFGWAQGLKVFEMVPAAQGEWIASLGYEKSVKFRVRLAADGSSCLEDTQGNKIRCVDSSGQIVGEEPGEGTDVPELEGTSLSSMTPAQLAELQKAITDELVKRASAGQ